MRFRKAISALKLRLHENPRPSQNNLDRKLEKYLNFRNGFFIEAGANDGYSQSNTFYLEKKLGWSGVLIEGIPELYEKCKRERTNSSVHNCALVSNDFSFTSATMHYAHLMSVVDGSLKTEEEQNKHIQAGIDVQRLDRTYSISVPARTLSSILDEISDLPTIDFLSLDVEGYELNVLKGLTFSKHRPKFILVEARYFNEIDEFLVNNGYEMIEKMSCLDFLYERKEIA
jgi:FkbM family methyltransferase